MSVPQAKFGLTAHFFRPLGLSQIRFKSSLKKNRAYAKLFNDLKSLLKDYRKIPITKFQNVFLMMSRSTYLCEPLFSQMKDVKSK